VGMDVFIL